MVISRDAEATDYDVVVVGSGFGGSVTALRLTEKGYRVGVLEAGRRFADEQFAKTSWDIRSFVWAPKLGCYGIQRIHMLRDCVILAGAGVGGGSLNYANTLYKPPAPFFNDPQWAHITDWFDELSPYYEQAQRMLGVVQNPHMTPADQIIKTVAEDMGVGDTFVQTPVGVFFGEPGKTVPDPFFGGAGPDRTGCIECGSCMTGCRYGAKNTLLKNYLGLAENAGATVHPLTTVSSVRQRPDGVWQVDTVRTGRTLRKNRRSFTARYVVLAAGTWGTQNLLHKMKDTATLPALSDRLGVLTRTNSESILGASKYHVDPTLDLTHGVAITSSFHPTGDTHVEPVRYGKGSNLMGLLLTTLMTDGGGHWPRWLKFLATAVKNPAALLRVLTVKNWSERTVIALVMQHLDNSITTFTKRGLRGRHLSSKQGHGQPNPTWIPAGNEATRRVAEKIDGISAGSWGELFNVPLTAHFLGGCVIGADPEHGVIDPYHRVYRYPTLSVVDGAAVSANLGVNPSLTIAAQAERAAAMWPNKGQQDERPEQGRGYRRVDPVAPRTPAVPAHAPGALRLPLVQIDPSPCGMPQGRGAAQNGSTGTQYGCAVPVTKE
jgi:cholesterol oxidase